MAARKLSARRPILLGLGFAGLALAASACGSAPTGTGNGGVANLKSTASTISSGAGGANNQPIGGALLEYATCMSAHGLRDFPDQATFAVSEGIKSAKGQIARITQTEASSPTFEAAQQSCAKYAPPTTPVPHVNTAETQKLLAVSRCMRAHGVANFPDPDPITGQLSTPAGVDRHSPQVLAALRACAALGKKAGLGPPNTG